MSDELESRIITELRETVALKRLMAESLPGRIADAARMLIAAYRAGSKVLLAGNGGSAADSQHIAAELVGHFQKQRDGLPAVALTTDTSVLTSLANDYGYEAVFKRQLAALGREGDVLIALSASGRSLNILKAAAMAHDLKMKVIALTGENPGKLGELADLTLAVPSAKTPRIQEAHITIGHIICALVEEELFR